MKIIPQTAHFAPTEPHRVLRCRFCGERFHNSAALTIHNPGVCQSAQSMERAGAWLGVLGVWTALDVAGDATPRTVTFPRRNSLNPLDGTAAGNGTGKGATLDVTRRRLCDCCRRPFQARVHTKTKFCSRACKQKAYRRRMAS